MRLRAVDPRAGKNAVIDKAQATTMSVKALLPGRGRSSAFDVTDAERTGFTALTITSLTVVNWPLSAESCS